MTIAPSADFQWASDEDVIVREQSAIAVYANRQGGIVIRQERAWDEDSDVFIVIQPVFAATVASSIMRALGDNAPLALPAPSDSTAAERQRRYRQRKKRDEQCHVTRDGELALRRNVTVGAHG